VTDERPDPDKRRNFSNLIRRSVSGSLVTRAEAKLVAGEPLTEAELEALEWEETKRRTR
jgi:hypothetical protein